MSFIMINSSYAVQPPLCHKILMGHVGSSRIINLSNNFIILYEEWRYHKKHWLITNKRLHFTAGLLLIPDYLPEMSVNSHSVCFDSLSTFAAGIFFFSLVTFFFSACLFLTPLNFLHIALRFEDILSPLADSHWSFIACWNVYQ